MSSKSAWVYDFSLQLMVPTSARIHLRLVLPPFQCVSLLPLSCLSVGIHDHTCVSVNSTPSCTASSTMLPFSLLFAADYTEGDYPVTL